MNVETLFQSRIDNIFFYKKSPTFFNEFYTKRKMARKFSVFHTEVRHNRTKV